MSVKPINGAIEDVSFASEVVPPEASRTLPAATTVLTTASLQCGVRFSIEIRLTCLVIVSKLVNGRGSDPRDPSGAPGGGWTNGTLWSAKAAEGAKGTGY